MITTRRELELAHESLSRQCQHYKTYPGIGWERVNGEQDRTPVPPDLLGRLMELARKRGYHVWFTDMIDGDPDILGQTSRALNYMTGEEIKEGIRLKAGMSEASTVRVLCHELGHTYHKAATHLSKAMCETVAESAAALVTGALRCTDGSYSLSYVAGYSGGRPERLRQIRRAAVTVASKILEGIGEHVV